MSYSAEYIQRTISSHESKFPIESINVAEELDDHIARFARRHREAHTDEAFGFLRWLCQPQEFQSYLAIRLAAIDFFVKFRQNGNLGRPTTFIPERSRYRGKPFPDSISPALAKAVLSYLRIVNPKEEKALKSGTYRQRPRGLVLLDREGHYQYRQPVDFLAKDQINLEGLINRMNLQAIMGLTTVLTHGSFDLGGHLGHDSLLNYGKIIGGLWSAQTVIIDSDWLVRLLKGNSRPFVNASLRQMHLSANMYVDTTYMIEDYPLLDGIIEDIRGTPQALDLIDHIFRSLYSRTRPNIVWIGPDKQKEFIEQVWRRTDPMGILMVKADEDTACLDHTTEIARRVVSKYNQGEST